MPISEHMLEEEPLSDAGILFRAAREGDAEQLAGLARQLATSGGRHAGAHFRRNGSASTCCGPAGRCGCSWSESEGRLAGYVAWSPMVETIYTSAGAYVGDLVVDAAHRGQGTGSRLLAVAAADARDNGRQHLWLVTGRDNQDADRFLTGVLPISARNRWASPSPTKPSTGWADEGVGR